jgi:hypothetical protein
MMLTSPEGGLGGLPRPLLMLEYGSMLEFDQRLQTAGSRSVGCDGTATVSLPMVRVPLKVKRFSSLITLK